MFESHAYRPTPRVSVDLKRVSKVSKEGPREGLWDTSHATLQAVHASPLPKKPSEHTHCVSRQWVASVHPHGRSAFTLRISSVASETP